MKDSALKLIKSLPQVLTEADLKQEMQCYTMVEEIVEEIGKLLNDSYMKVSELPIQSFLPDIYEMLTDMSAVGKEELGYVNRWIELINR